MANLSPFQRGCGSLQVFSVHQKVPSGPSNDFALTGLRRDVVTASARGVFAEPDLTTTEEETVVAADISGTRHPGSFLTPACSRSDSSGYSVLNAFVFCT